MAWIRCFDMLNPKGGATTVDYLVGSPSLIPEIQAFTISGRPVGLAADRAYLHFEKKDGSTRDAYLRFEKKNGSTRWNCRVHCI